MTVFEILIGLCVALLPGVLAFALLWLCLNIAARTGLLPVDPDELSVKRVLRPASLRQLLPW